MPDRASFVAAQPVWPAGREREMNLAVGFRAVVEGRQQGLVTLRVTACSVYRATVNGEFAGYGPARAAHGWFRVDEWNLTPYLRPGRNVVALEVAAYNAASYYYVDHPAFVQAEVVAGERVLAATGEGGDFTALPLTYRVKKVARYSFQRPFSEAYHLSPGDLDWRQAAEYRVAHPAPLALQPAPRELLPRGVPLPECRVVAAVAQVARGRRINPDPGAEILGSQVELLRGSFTPDTTPSVEGYLEAELTEKPWLELQTVRFSTEAKRKPAAAQALDEGEHRIFDFGKNYTGFVRLRVQCARPVRLFLSFDELLTEGDVNFLRLGCANVVAYTLAPGAYDLEGFEAYTLRYLKVIAVEGACEIGVPELRTYAGSHAERGRFACSDHRLERLFEAGRETYRQNAVDLFTDCPSRERAGWLCDSFFTARVAADLTGETAVERNFLENYLLPDHFPDLPEGMLPMCYPADHTNGNFIPNWAMWFVVQLEEYLARSGDREMVEALRPRVLALLEYLKQFRNDDGLLEKLPRWVFIEWSKSNDFVQDVSYPSNMLYAGTLDVAGRLYGLADLRSEAEAVREKIRERSFDGEFFVDNAVRQGDGRLVETRNRTESCQYYAFFFDVATREKHPELWRKLVEEFGPKRAERGLHPEIHPANSFIGNMLRVEILSRAGLAQQILDESVDYLMYMAERTGTLWEFAEDIASCNHGFASHICHTLYRDILGVAQLDRVDKRVVLRFPSLRLKWCEGALPVPEGEVAIRWERDAAGTVTYTVEAPEGYRYVVE